MRNDMASYFEDPEFKESLARYEDMEKNQASAYFDADELTDIAEYYASKGRHEEADKAIALALQLHPGSTDALIFRARALALEGDLEKAHEVASLIEDTTDREVKFLEADLLIEENRMKEADEIFQQLATDEDNDLETLIDIVYDYIDVNRADYAKKWLRRLSASYDTHRLPEKHAYFRDMLCDYYLTFNQPEKAIPLLRVALDKQPYSVHYWVELAKCYFRLCNYEETHEALDFALAIDDKDEDVLTFKAITYKQSGNPQEAARIYRKLIEMNGYKSRLVLALVKTYFDMQDYRQALAYMNALISRNQSAADDEKAEWYSELALCYAGAGRFKDGYECIRKARELDLYDLDSRINIGHFYLMDKRKDSAVEEFENALEDAEPEDLFEILMMIATACFDTHHFGLAIRYFEQINNDFPENARTTYFFLLYCYYQLRQVAPLMHYFLKIKAETPEIYEQLGNPNEDLLADKSFNDMLHALKEGIGNGEIASDNYS